MVNFLSREFSALHSGAAREMTLRTAAQQAGGLMSEEEAGDVGG